MTDPKLMEKAGSIVSDIMNDVALTPDQLEERIAQALQQHGGEQRNLALEEAAKTAWNIASNSRADTFEDLREEVDTAIRNLKGKK